MSTAPSHPPLPITPEDLLMMPDGDRYELVDGELVERNAGFLSSVYASRLNRYLGAWCEEHQLGWVFDATAGYQCFADSPHKIRRPNISLVAAKRLNADQLSADYCPIAPDLAVEVVSPNDITEQVFEKVYEYLGAGVSLVWVLIPSAQTVLVLRKEGGGAILRAGDVLDGENVVPGFRCSVDDLFRPPPGTEPAG
jgi:Uma2 family endonuclease